MLWVVQENRRQYRELFYTAGIGGGISGAILFEVCSALALHCLRQRSLGSDRSQGYAGGFAPECVGWHALRGVPAAAERPARREGGRGRGPLSVLLLNWLLVSPVLPTLLPSACTCAVICTV